MQLALPALLVTGHATGVAKLIVYPDPTPTQPYGADTMPIEPRSYGSVYLYPMGHICNTIANALRRYRADAQRCLLGLAYARPPHRAIAPHADGEDTLTWVPAHWTLPDPGAWPGAIEQLLHGPSARRLTVLELDSGVFALVEVRWLELSQVGPPAGILRLCGAHSPAWQHVCDAVLAQEKTPLAERVAKQIDRHTAHLSAAMRRSLMMLYDDLAATWTPLTRLAAAHDSKAGSYAAKAPAVVRGAPGWAVNMRVEPTVDGAWMVTAERVWTGTGPKPAVAPGIMLIIQRDQSRHARVLQRHIDNRNPSAMWYEDQPFGPAPKLSAHRDDQQ